MSQKIKGKLIIIGGGEDTAHEQTILKEVCPVSQGKNGRDRLLIVTVASTSPQETADKYTQFFTDVGVKEIDVLDIPSRDDAHDAAKVQQMEQAKVIFFTGGDQLRITSQLGDSPLYQCLMKRFVAGATVAGTSAGAAAMPQTMIVSGQSDESNRISTLGMAPGLGLIDGVIIDSHFAERGRMGRLLGAIAQNPANLGLGIDEDTAIIVAEDQFHVIGTGAVYVVDGTGITYSSLSEEQSEGIVSIFNVKLHVLGEGDRFNLSEKQPILPEKQAETR